MAEYRFDGGVLLSRFLLSIYQQLKSPVRVPEGGSTAPVTDALASVVEQVGVVVLMALIGWLLTASFGSIWYFVVAVLFGAVGSVLRSYFRSRLEMEEAMVMWTMKKKQRTDADRGEGFSGLLEGATASDVDTLDE